MIMAKNKEEDKDHPEHLTPHSLDPLMTPLGQAVQNLPQGGMGMGFDITDQEGGGILSALKGFLTDPRFLGAVGGATAGLAGPQQLQSFLQSQNQRGQQKLQREIEQGRARREEERTDISRGHLSARREEELARDRRSKAATRSAEIKADTATKRSFIGIKIANGGGASEDELVGGYGEVARGFSISSKPTLGQDTVDLFIPKNRQDLREAFGGSTYTTTRGGVNQAIETILGKEEQNRVFNVGGRVLIEEQPDGRGGVDFVEVYKGEQEPDIAEPRPFLMSEQRAIREYLKPLIDGWNMMTPEDQVRMINLYRKIELNGDAPQPVTSEVSRGLWNWMRRMVGANPNSETVITGIEAPTPSLDDEIERFLRGE